VALRNANPPRKRLLVHLSQAVKTLSLRKELGTLAVPLDGIVEGNVKVQFFEVNGREFDHFENISNALTRLDQGTYGRCAFCGCRIEEDILAHTPWATECLGCQDQESQP
jgi:RNA polymerase-binding transcription factor DksA